MFLFPRVVIQKPDDTKSVIAASRQFPADDLPRFSGSGNHDVNQPEIQLLHQETHKKTADREQKNRKSHAEKQDTPRQMLSLPGEKAADEKQEINIENGQGNPPYFLDFVQADSGIKETAVVDTEKSIVNQEQEQKRQSFTANGTEVADASCPPGMNVSRQQKDP